ncbi:MAG: hypothetical protein ACJ749_08040 [Flavisolibacter sp.]
MKIVSKIGGNKLKWQRFTENYYQGTRYKELMKKEQETRKEETARKYSTINYQLSTFNYEQRITLI